MLEISQSIDIVSFFEERAGLYYGGKERSNNYDTSAFLEVATEEADLASSGSEFHSQGT